MYRLEPKNRGNTSDAQWKEIPNDHSNHRFAIFAALVALSTASHRFVQSVPTIKTARGIYSRVLVGSNPFLENPKP